MTISRACAGPPTHATRLAPSACESSVVGASPSGGTRPLASEIDRRAAPEPGRLEAGDHLVEPARRDAEEHVVRARQPGAHRLDPQLAREHDPGQVLAVLAVALEPLALLGRARLERRPEPAAGEQHGDAVPNDPAPITTARRDPGCGEREMGPRRHRVMMPRQGASGGRHDDRGGRT